MIDSVGSQECLARAQSRVGATLRDKWTLMRLIGVGGMAAVYEAVHRNGKRVAIKMLHRELSADADVRARFLREGYVANRVGHPGAVSVSDDDKGEDGSVFLVMDLLEGEPLDMMLARVGSLKVDQVLVVGDQLLDVLGAAHAQGIIHRDIKPANVFMLRDGSLRVLDFGIARLREVSSSATRTGSLMGTPAFMPPEQARGRWSEVDGRCDIWAVGAVMFTLLTGRTVHNAETVNEVLLEAMTKQSPPVRTFVPELPEEIASVIDRALAFKREDRWPDAKSMQDAIRRCRADEALMARASRIAQVIAAATAVGTMDEHTIPRHLPAQSPLDSAALMPVESWTGGRRKQTVWVAVAGAVVVAALVVVVIASRQFLSTSSVSADKGASVSSSSSTTSTVVPAVSTAPPSVSVSAAASSSAASNPPAVASTTKGRGAVTAPAPPSASAKKSKGIDWDKRN